MKHALLVTLLIAISSTQMLASDPFPNFDGLEALHQANWVRQVDLSYAPARGSLEAAFQDCYFYQDAQQAHLVLAVVNHLTSEIYRTV